MLVGAAVVQVGGHLGAERGGLGTVACCWSRGQDWLELGNFSKRFLRVPSCFLRSNADVLIKPPLPPQVRKAQMSPLCAGNRRLPKGRCSGRAGTALTICTSLVVLLL